MRHWFCAALLALILFTAINPAYAARSDWNIQISINPDGSADWKITLNYTENVTKSDYWVFSKLSNLHVYVNGSEVKCRTDILELGTSILCENIPSTDSIVYSFTTTGQISAFQNFQRFTYTFGVTDPTAHFSVLVKLPLGTALVEKAKLVGMPVAPFEPAFGLEGTDGRQIFVRWEIANPRLGESLAVSILFEQVGQTGLPIELLVAIIAIAIVAVLAIFWHFRVAARRDILPALAPAERIVMELLLESRVIDQAELVRQTGFSKAKVSRIVRALASRGLVTTREHGKTKEVRLVETGRWKGLRRTKFSKSAASKLIKPWINHLRHEINAAKTQFFTPDAKPFAELRVESEMREIYDELRHSNPRIEALFIAHNRAVRRFYAELRRFTNQKTIRALADDVRNVCERFVEELRDVQRKGE